MDLSLPSADAVVHNSRVLFANQCVMSSNKTVQCCESHIRCKCISTFVHMFVCFYVYLYFFYRHNYVWNKTMDGRMDGWIAPLSQEPRIYVSYWYNETKATYLPLCVN